MGDKLNLKYYENTLQFGAGNARLFGRYQIQAKCSLECRTFRYGTKVDDIATSHQTISKHLRILAIWSIVIGMILFLLCVYVVFVKKYKVTQMLFLSVTGFALLCLFVFLVFGLYIRRKISNYNVLQAYFVTANTDKCVISKGWAAVLSKYVEHTSLKSCGNVLIFLLITYGLLFVVGVLLLWYVLKTIGKVKNPQFG